jgi:AI-2 transport protein TqsA
MPEPTEAQSGAKVRTACLLVLAFVAAGVALYLLRPVLVPFVLALFLAYGLGGIIDTLVHRLHMSRTLAIITTAVLGLAVLALVGLLVVVSVSQIAAELQTYGAKVESMMAGLNTWITENVPLEKLGIKPDPVTGSLFTIPPDTVSAAISTVRTTVTSLVLTGALVMVFVILLLVGGPKVTTAVGSGSVLDGVAGRVRTYTLQMFLLSALTGALIGGSLAVMGVRFALVFGFLAFLLNFIPTIGAIVATLLPVPIVFLTPGVSPTVQVLAILIPAAIQGVIGNFVQPRVLGRSFGLHPVSILLAVVFFGMIWGLVGAFLATPITAVIKVALERIPETRFVAALLAGTYGSAPTEESGPARG